MRSILLAFALVLVLPASALAAGTLTVSISGAGAVAGDGIGCTRAPVVGYTGACSAELAAPVTLTATPAAGFRFDGWTGACAGTSACAVDMAGDRDVTAAFHDVQPPTVNLQEPLAGSVKGPMPIVADVTDNGQIDRVEFLMGKVPWKDFVAPYGSTLPVPTAMFPDGPVKITATAFDKTGNSRTTSVDVIFDNTAPVIGATGPDRQGFAPGSTQTWTTPPATRRRRSRRAAAWCCKGAARVFAPCSGDGTHSVSGLPEGRYEFTFAARDAAGNYAETVRLFRIETPEAAEAASPPRRRPSTATSIPRPASTSRLRLSAAAAALGAPAAADAPPKIAVALLFRYASLSRATKLSNFVVRGVPAGATVTVSCVKGCTKKALKRFVKRAGRISLKALARRPLKVDTTITVVVSKPGHTSAVKVLEIRARKAPLVTTQCQLEGASEPSAC